MRNNDAEVWGPGAGAKSMSGIPESSPKEEPYADERADGMSKDIVGNHNSIDVCIELRIAWR